MQSSPTESARSQPETDSTESGSKDSSGRVGAGVPNPVGRVPESPFRSVTGALVSILFSITPAVSGALARLLEIIVVTPLQLNIVEGITNAFEVAGDAFFKSLFDFVGTILLGLTEQFLFFRPPGQYPALVAIYDRTTVVFWILLPVGALVFLINYQMFPYSQNADPTDFGQRALAGVVMLLLGKPAINLVVKLTNATGRYIYPEQYSLSLLGGGILDGLATNIAGIGTGLVAVFIHVVGGVSLVGTLGAQLLVFYGTLAMRMVLVYAFFAMFPVLAVLWIFEMGPAKYGKMVAGLMFKIVAIVLFVGIIVSAILGATGAIANSQGDYEANTYESIDISEPPRGGQTASFQRPAEGTSRGGEFDSQDTGGLGHALLGIFSYFGGLALSIFLVTLLPISGAITQFRGGGGGRAMAAGKQESEATEDLGKGQGDGNLLEQGIDKLDEATNGRLSNLADSDVDEAWSGDVAEAEGFSEEFRRGDDMPDDLLGGEDMADGMAEESVVEPLKKPARAGVAAAGSAANVARNVKSAGESTYGMYEDIYGADSWSESVDAMKSHSAGAVDSVYGGMDKVSSEGLSQTLSDAKDNLFEAPSADPDVQPMDHKEIFGDPEAMQNAQEALENGGMDADMIVDQYDDLQNQQDLRNALERAPDLASPGAAGAGAGPRSGSMNGASSGGGEGGNLQDIGEIGASEFTRGGETELSDEEFAESEFSMNNVRYEQANEPVSEKMEQKGYLVDEGSNTRVPYVNFNEDAPQLEDGQSYNISGLRGSTFQRPNGQPGHKGHQHNGNIAGTEGSYRQAKATPQMSASPVEASSRGNSSATKGAEVNTDETPDLSGGSVDGDR